MRAFALIYGLAVYAFMLVGFAYAIGFVGNLVVPKSIDAGWFPADSKPPFAVALIIDLLVLALFAVQHSVMARQSFKRWWTRIVPSTIERSTYVLFSTLALIAIFVFWQPITTPIWHIETPLARMALHALFWIGWALVLASTFFIDHFEMFGLRQVLARTTDRALPQAAFKTPFLYRHTRHPLYLGFLLAFWATPEMSAGHLLFALATTGYILIGIRFEERDLIAQFGDRYRRYREEVRMLLPLPRARSGTRARAEAEAEQARRS